MGFSCLKTSKVMNKLDFFSFFFENLKEFS